MFTTARTAQDWYRRLPRCWAGVWGHWQDSSRWSRACPASQGSVCVCVCVCVCSGELEQIIATSKIVCVCSVCGGELEQR